MEEQDNKQLIEDMYEAMNKNVLGLMKKYWFDDMVWEGPAGVGTKRGLQEFEEDYRQDFIHAFRTSMLQIWCVLPKVIG